MTQSLGGTFQPAITGDIPTINRQLFADNVYQVAEQRTSRLMNLVARQPISGGEVVFMDILEELTGHTTPGAESNSPPFQPGDGANAEYNPGSRYEKTQWRYPVWKQRQLIPTEWRWAAPIERKDQKRITNDFSINGQYTRKATSSLGRRIDKDIITALDDSVTEIQRDTSTPSTTSKNTNTVSFPDSQILEPATPLSVEALRDAKEKLDAAEVPEEGRILLHASSDLNDLLGITEITSADFNTVKALVQGDVNTYMGFRFVRSELLGTTSGGRRKIFAFQMDGIRLGFEEEMFSRVDERADYNYLTQIYLSMSLGAVRMEEEKVVRIDVPND